MEGGGECSRLWVEDWRLKMRGLGLGIICYILRTGDWGLRNGY